MNAKQAIFLDRDGVIIEEINYLSHPDQVRLIPGAAKAIQKLNHLGIPVVVVSNQAGVAKGFFPITQIPLVHTRLVELLAEENAYLDGIFFCPHHPDGSVPEYAISCLCRKPEMGMLLQAKAKLNLNLTKSWLIGDNITDILAGSKAGCKSILVLTGHGKQFDLNQLPKDAWVKNDLLDAVDFILESTSSLGHCA